MSMRGYEIMGAQQRNEQTDCDRITAALEASNEQLEKLVAIREAATKWPRCCDLWQDGLGGMHCRDCAQKTFAMMREVQKILGVNKGCKPVC